MAVPTPPPDLQTLIRSALLADSQLVTTDKLSGVYQADTAESPSAKPFIVVRWLDVQPGMNALKKRPFTLWVYDEEGDYSRAKRMADRAAKVIIAIPPTQLSAGGWLAQFDDGEMGAELADDGWKAVVVPYSLTAISSGV